MGHLADLSVEWAPYKAAKAALANVLSPARVAELNAANAKATEAQLIDVGRFLQEGSLTEATLLDDVTGLLDCIRGCNVALRWRLLHRRTGKAEFAKIVTDEKAVPGERVVDLLLQTSQLEYVLPRLVLRRLPDSRLTLPPSPPGTAPRACSSSSWTSASAGGRPSRTRPRSAWGSSRRTSPGPRP